MTRLANGSEAFSRIKRQVPGEQLLDPVDGMIGNTGKHWRRYRAKTPTQQQGRLAFIERLCQDLPVHPVTLDIARLAGRIEGQREINFLKRKAANLSFQITEATSG
jgi:hypothetical protein